MVVYQPLIICKTYQIHTKQEEWTASCETYIKMNPAIFVNDQMNDKCPLLMARCDRPSYLSFFVYFELGVMVVPGRKSRADLSDQWTL